MNFKFKFVYQIGDVHVLLVYIVTNASAPVSPHFVSLMSMPHKTKPQFAPISPSLEYCRSTPEIFLHPFEASCPYFPFTHCPKFASNYSTGALTCSQESTCISTRIFRGGYLKVCEYILNALIGGPFVILLPPVALSERRQQHQAYFTTSNNFRRRSLSSFSSLLFVGTFAAVLIAGNEVRHFLHC